MNDLKQYIVVHKNNIIGISAAIIILVLIICVRLNTESKLKTIKVENDEVSAVVEKVVIDPVQVEADKVKLKELKTKFNYSYDEFEGKGWYSNKTQIVQNTFDKKMLQVYVNNVGYAYLADQYYSDDWLFHSRIEVKVGDSIYKTDDIPTYDSDNKTENGGGSIWESISYTAGRDNGIIKAIAESGNTPVKVRFAGDHGVFDMTLSERDRQAIKDAYELSNLIKKTGDIGSVK